MNNTPLRWTVDGGGTLLLRATVVVIPLLLVIAGDVETNPGPEGKCCLDEGELMQHGAINNSVQRLLAKCVFEHT